MSSEPCVPAERPFFAMLEITPQCNSRCVYCSCWYPSTKSPALSAAQCRKLLPDLHAIGVRRLVLTGGEPLLHPEIEQLVQLGYRNRLHTSLVTNGIALSERRYRALVAHGLLGLTLSLDTLDPETYQRLRGVPIHFALKAVGLLSSAAAEDGVSVSINCVATALNMPHIPDLVRFASERRIPVMIQPCNTDNNPRLAHLVPQEAEIPQVEQIIHSVIKMKQQGFSILSSESFLMNMVEYWLRGCTPPVKACYYGHVTVTVRHTGAVNPCWRLPEVGSIQTQPIQAIRSSDGYAQWLNKMVAGQCPGCWLACSYDWKTLWATEEQVERFWKTRLPA